MTKEQPGLRECCAKPENLVVRAGGEIITLTTGELYVVPFGEDLVIRQCQVCQARHFEQSVDPGEMGIDIAPINLSRNGD